MKEEKSILMFRIRWLVIVGLVLAIYFSVKPNLSNFSKHNASAQAEVLVVPSPQVAATADTDTKSYKLVVGANPRLGSKQTFSPPTGSVVVTNEAQLELLREQARKSRQQVQK